MTKPERVDILLVEDDASDAETTTHALRERDLARQLHWVKDGEEALEYLFASGRYAGRDRRDAPKLVLLDIKMPKLDGFEVLRRIKNSELKSIPVVVLTSSSEESDVLESYRLGVDSYLVKPVQSQAFLATVAKIGL
jgi:two-component system, response regulator